MNKFEQLIEYIINDEEDKAKELFHEVVVEKSRDIYENLMAEEEQVEESTEETVEEATESDEETVEESTEEVAEDAVEESIVDEITDETEIGGDASDDLVDEIEADEEGIALEGEDEEDLEDRVVDLEDKLDELMAEFEELMNDEDKEEAPEEEPEMDIDMGDEAEEEGEEEEEVEMPMESEEEVAEEEQVDEAVSLKPVKADNKDHATNKSSPVPANGGAKEKLADAHPASNAAEKGRPAPSAKELPHGTTEPNPGPATTAEKADKAENKKSPV